MSRPTGSKNKETPPEIVQADEADRLAYLATLLTEIAEAELQESEEVTCTPS